MGVLEASGNGSIPFTPNNIMGLIATYYSFIGVSLSWAEMKGICVGLEPDVDEDFLLEFFKTWAEKLGLEVLQHGYSGEYVGIGSEIKEFVDDGWLRNDGRTLDDLKPVFDNVTTKLRDTPISFEVELHMVTKWS
jgi:hypothetical protein